MDTPYIFLVGLWLYYVVADYRQALFRNLV